MDWIVTFLLGVLLILAITHFTVHHALRGSVPIKGKTNIPGPGWTLPIIGDAWRFAGISNMKELYKTTEKLQGGCSRAMSFWMGPKLMVFVTDPKMGEAILNSPKATNKDPDAYHGFNAFTDGVFSRNGKGWRELRRPLNNMMRPENIMKNYYDVFTARAEELRGTLSNMCGKGTFDVLKFNQDCMVDVAFETLMGVPGESKLDERFDWSVMTRTIVICLQLAINPAYKFSYLRRFSALERDLKHIQSKVLKLLKRLLKKRTKILEENYINPNDQDFEPETYMDIALKVTKNELDAGKKDTYYREISKPFDMIVAAYGTSSFTVSTVLLFLAQHPEYQKKAYREQISIMGDTLRAPTEEELARMDYLDMVYQETLRHVGVPGIFRLISSELVVDDYIFPEGTAVYLSIHYWNKVPEHWEKPKEFHPDHFLPENVAKRPRAAWLPFSSGSRACPGVTFGRTAVMIILSTLLRSFKFSTPLKYEEMEYEYMIMLESTNGYPLQLDRRSVTAA